MSPTPSTRHTIHTKARCNVQGGACNLQGRSRASARVDRPDAPRTAGVSNRAGAAPRLRASAARVRPRPRHCASVGPCTTARQQQSLHTRQQPRPPLLHTRRPGRRPRATLRPPLSRVRRATDARAFDSRPSPPPFSSKAPATKEPHHTRLTLGRAVCSRPPPPHTRGHRHSISRARW